MTHRSLYATEEPRVFMFDDGRHKASLYQMEPPLAPRTSCTTWTSWWTAASICWSTPPGSRGCGALRQSRGPEVGRQRDQLDAHGMVPGRAQHPAAHRRRLRPPEADLRPQPREGRLVHRRHWVNFPGGDRETDGGLGRKSDFVYEHPEFQVGAERDPRSGSQYSWGSIPTRFSFLHPEVRNERFVVFREMLSRYETDGVLLNLIDYAPFCKFSEVGQLAPVLTQWVRDLREVASEAERDQGRRKRIYVHIPSHPDAWAAVGYDVPTWVSDNLVDGLVCQSGLSHGPIDQDTDLSDAVDLVRDTDCRVLVALRGGGTAPLIWAAAANAYAQGADGIGFGGSSWSMSGWPWTGPEYQTFAFSDIQTC